MKYIYIAVGLSIIFAGTTLGSAMVFLLRKKINDNLEKFLQGFAAGVMIAASVWSLIVPAIELSSSLNRLAWLPATIGFLLGVAFMIVLNALVPNPEDNPHTKSTTKNMLFAITIHNIPEGMAVGVALSGLLNSGSGVSIAGALALSFGIAIQNLPEGAIISLPLKSQGYSNKKAFLYGTFSGSVEPVAGLLALLISQIITPVLPYLLAFAAGAMIYVVANELIPQCASQTRVNFGVVGIALGFAIMMILDVSLG